MDWYAIATLASERQEDLAREAMRMRQVLEVTKNRTSPTDRLLLAFGRWMVSSGRRLQARRAACVDTVSALYVPQPRRSARHGD